MAKNKPAPEIPSSKTVNDIGISGPLTDKQSADLRNLISQMAPNTLPSSIAFVPADAYKKTTSQISRTGMFGGMQIGRGDGAQESFGSQGSTHLGNGFSIRSMGRTWLNADILNDPKQLKATLAHEIGHFNSPDASEDAADANKDVYLKRVDQIGKIDNAVASLPVSTRTTPYVVGIGDKVVQFPADMSEDDVSKASAQIHSDSQAQNTNTNTNTDADTTPAANPAVNPAANPATN